MVANSADGFRLQSSAGRRGLSCARHGLNFLVDEGVDRQIVHRLRSEGHAVIYVAELEPGISDDAVLDIANRESAVLVTSDKDFGEIIWTAQP